MEEFAKIKDKLFQVPFFIFTKYFNKQKYEQSVDKLYWIKKNEDALLSEIDYLKTDVQRLI